MVMKYVLDMVHDNPGEAPFETSFRDPKVLKEFGYNGQVFKYWNCAADFHDFDPRLFRPGDRDLVWMAGLREKLAEQFGKAKRAGLKVYCHIDLFVLPVKLVQKYQGSLCDENGRISINAPLTLKIHRIMFDELFSLFPEVDGLIIRVGETYLYDTPFHTGNGPIRSSQYEGSEVPVSVEQERYVKLIDFLREEICVRHGKLLFFRTWDCYPDRFHASLPYYLSVTDRIPVHEKLFFSIKHTALDFWRYVRFNPCIGQGKHKQIVEVQCQREYEGKGAYPDYIMDGVINGFPETEHPEGLKDALKSGLVCGIFGWSRGGGWYGPYLKNEFWCRLNAAVLARWSNDTDQDEEIIFHAFARRELGLTEGDAAKLRLICSLSQQAVLYGRYCGPYDRTLHGKLMPTALWMRDDRLGGLQQLEPVFKNLKSAGTLDEALKEKCKSVEIWEKILRLSGSLTSGNAELRNYLVTSSRYGHDLFQLVSAAWKIFARAYNGTLQEKNAKKDFADYDRALLQYESIETLPDAPTLYRGIYLNLPGSPECKGMQDSIEQCRAEAEGQS
jgi:hypothetical protein